MGSYSQGSARSGETRYTVTPREAASCRVPPCPPPSLLPTYTPQGEKEEKHLLPTSHRPARPLSTHVLVVLHHPHRQRRVGPQASPAGPLPAAHASAAPGPVRPHSPAQPLRATVSPRAVLPPAAPSHRFPLPDAGRCGLGWPRRRGARWARRARLPAGGLRGGQGIPLGRSAGCAAVPRVACGVGGRWGPVPGTLQERSRWRRCWRLPRCGWVLGSGWRGPDGPCRQRLLRQPPGRPAAEEAAPCGGKAARQTLPGPGVGLVAGFVTADPSVAVGSRYEPLGGSGWMRPVAFRCVRAGREEFVCDSFYQCNKLSFLGDKKRRICPFRCTGPYLTENGT